MQTTKMPLAITTIPVQPWGDVYPANTAMRKGTIFPDLNMPFYVVDGILDSPLTAELNKDVKDPKQQEREALMSKIMQVSFFLDDLTLYLDTHEEDKDALRLLGEKGMERHQLLEEFAEKFYPLTRDCIATCNNAAEENLWAKGPMPWEGACL